MVSVTRAVFGDLPSGAGTVEKFQLQSDLLRVDIISWGCTITALEVKDRQGKASDVVLGFAELEGGWNSGPGPLLTSPHSRRIGLLVKQGPRGRIRAWDRQECLISLTHCVAISAWKKDKMNRNNHRIWPLVIHSSFALINFKGQSE